ncbi:MAG: aminoglycoside phosphotransferase family protein [Armatimonadota bacterium]
MLEQSVASLGEIRSILADGFGIRDVREVSGLAGGNTSLYLVTTDSERLVLKQFPQGYMVGGVLKEPEIASLLSAHGVPTTRFLPALSGEHALLFRGRVFHLREYVEGRTYANNTAPEWLIRDSAILLGRIHKALVHAAPLPDGLAGEWFVFDAAERLGKLANLLREAESLPESKVKERIVEDLAYKCDAVSKTLEVRVDPGRLTRLNSHGDYSVRQLVCGPYSVRAVIDLSGACVLSAAWEIIRSYTMADPRCAGGEIEAARLIRYLKWYKEPLSSYDLWAMPLIYMLHLLRSDVGYRQYIDHPCADTERWIRFGFWRTRLARGLMERWEELAWELTAT